MTPTTKSFLPIALSRATASSPDSTGIWLSKNTTAYLHSSDVEVDPVGTPSSDSPPEPVSSEDGVSCVCPGLRISSSAISPFSAVVTLHPSRVSIRLMSLRVSGSSSTTSTFSFVSYCTAPVGAPDDPAWLGSVFVVPAEGVGEMSAPSIENVCGFGICDRWRPLTVSNECSTDGRGRSGAEGSRLARSGAHRSLSTGRRSSS